MVNLDFLNNDYVDSRTLSEKVKEQLQIEILNGTMRNGRKLSEQVICDRFGLSRPPVREIFNQLAAEGYIALIQNRGAFVKGLSPQEIDDTLYLKNLLYPQAVEWAVQRISADELNILTETFGFIQFYYPTEDLNKLQKFCRGFDKIIYDSCCNREIERALLKYDFIIEHAITDFRLPVNYATALYEEYRAIFDAFRSRNVRQGTEAAQVHAFRSMLRSKARDN